MLEIIKSNYKKIMKNNIIVVRSIVGLIIGLIVTLVMVVAIKTSTPNTGGGFQQYGLYSQTSTSSSVSLSSDLRLVATGTQNRVLRFTPSASCTQGFYLSLANDKAATVADGMFVAASSSFQLDANNRYTGSVRGISNGDTCVLNVTGNN